MNTQIRRLAIGLIVLYIGLFISINFWQVGQTGRLASRSSNTRALIRQYDKPRGPILTADGAVVAQSVQLPKDVDSDVRFQREYPTGDLFANVVGYYTFGLGSTKLERTQSDVLTGDTTQQKVLAVEGYLGQAADNSGRVILTLREDLQTLAKFLLGDREGSIVLMEPRTGAVRAMWSFPSFDPNQVVQPDYDSAYNYLLSLQEDERDPLLNNAYQQRYMPGSTFKVLTTGAALDAGVITLDSTWQSETEWTPPQTNDPIMNYAGESCGGDLAEVFRRSCNIPFAQTAVGLGPDLFRERIGRWGVDQTIPFDIPGGAESTIGDMTNLDQNLPLLAMRGFGQNEDQMVPLHMAMVASAVAADGAMMKPYVVEAQLDNDGNVLSRHEAEVWRYPVSRGTAGVLRDLMVGVAQDGTARCCIALDGGISVAAKTGTAQLNGPGEPQRSHAWIIAFAPVEDPQYAVAVMLKGTNEAISASTGGQLAGPVAKEMLDAAFAAPPLTGAAQPAPAPAEPDPTANTTVADTVAPGADGEG